MSLPASIQSRARLFLDAGLTVSGMPLGRERGRRTLHSVGLVDQPVILAEAPGMDLLHPTLASRETVALAFLRPALTFDGPGPRVHI